MNRLKTGETTKMVNCLVQGKNTRTTVGLTGVAKNTVAKLLADLGNVCAKYQDNVFRNLKSRRLQCDKISSFAYAKHKNLPEDLCGADGVGSVWTWTAIDADTNLSMHMNMRRFTRLTNAFSRKVENHKHIISIYFMYYNFARIHQTLRVAPAMEAGITDHVWSLGQIENLIPSETIKTKETK